MKHLFTFISAALLACSSSIAAEVVPYSHDFNDAECLEGWTTLANSERVRFKYVEAGQRPSYCFRNAVVSNSIYSAGTIESKDSWLISPAITLEAGKEYLVSYRFALTNTASEFIGLYFGTEPTADAMKSEASPMSNYFGKGFLEESATMILEGKVKPETSGTYYIGLYDNSSKYASAIAAIYDFSVTVGASGQMPSAPTDFMLTADPAGKLEVTLSAKAPDTDVAGAAITSLKSMEFLRGEEVIHTVDSPVPGNTYTFTDQHPVNGNNTYGVVASNEYGKSNIVHEMVKAGVALPQPVTGVQAIQTSPGRVKATWTKPTKDITGFVLDPSLVKTKVEVLSGDVVMDTYENIADSELEFEVCDPDAIQDFYSLKVYAVTTGGEAVPDEYVGLAAGKPYATPFKESFPDGEPTHTFYVSENEVYQATWEFEEYDPYVGIGCARFSGNAVMAEASLLSGSISIPSDEQTVLSFQYGTLGTCDNELLVKVIGEAGSETLCTLKGMTSELKTVEYDLSSYKGQNIQIAFTGRYYTGSFFIVVTEIKIGKPGLSGIEDLDYDSTGAPVYYDLNGCRVINPEKGLYIKVKDGKHEKMIVK